MLEQETISRIRILLKAFPKGLTITDISSRLKMNRNSAAKYLEILQISGQVESKSYGTAKVYFLTHRLPISALVSIASDLVITLDDNYKILFVNEGFCRLFQIKNEEATGSHIVDIFKAGFGRDVLPDVFAELIADQDTVREVHLPREGGDLFFKIRSMKTVFDDGSRGITITMEDVTREKMDKRELEAKEARYRGIVEDQTEFIVRFLPDGTLTFVNDSYAHFMDRDKGELPGTVFCEGIQQRDRAVFDRAIAEVSRENPVSSFECRATVPKGPARWTAWTLRALYGSGKEPVEYQAVGHDISENKEAAEKIRQYITQMEFFSTELQHFTELSPGDNVYEAICSGLARIIPDAAISVSSYDPGSVTLTVRAFFAASDREVITRCLGRELVGVKVRVGKNAPPERFFNGRVYNTKKNLYDIFFRQFPEEVCADIERSVNMGEIYSVGLIWKKELLGNITFALKKGRYLRNETCVEAYVKAASIALKRAVAETALRESENLYRTVIENIQDVFYRTDTEGNLIMASPSWAKLLEYPSPDECIGRSIAQDFYLEPEKRKDFLAEIALKGSVGNYEVVLKKKDGTPVHVATNSHIYYDKTGNILGVEGIFHDISERKEAEARVRHYIDELEFLSQKLQEFILTDRPETIYDKIAADLQNLIPGAMILVNSYDRKTDQLTIRSKVATSRQREIVLKVLGTEITGSKVPLAAAGGVALRTGKLDKADVSLHELSCGSIPGPVCDKLAADLEIETIYAIGFIRGTEILGNATIFLGHGGVIPDPGLVELYARVTAIALQRFHAEEARRRSDEIFYNIAQSSPLPIALIGQDGTCQYINRSFTRLFGYDLNDFRTGKEWSRLIFPDLDLWEQTLAAWKAGRAEEQTVPLLPQTFPVRCKDGSERDVIFLPVDLPDGNQCILCEDITERNKAERTHRLLSSIISSTGDAVIAKDLKGTVISWNHAAEQLYGYAGSEMIGRNIARIVPADRTEEMQRIFGRIELGESVRNTETQRIRKDGRTIDVSVTISPITDENGKVIGASTIARDISPHKAEERLRENEQQVRSLVENIDVGIYRSTGDPTGRFVWGNSSLVHMLGYPSLEDLRDVGISQIFVEHDGRRRLLDDLKREGFVRNREIELRRPDGETVNVLVTALARFGMGGEVSCINGIVENITSRRKAENRVLLADRQLRDILGSVSDPVMILDGENAVAEWNAAMEQLTGVSRSGIAGRKDSEALMPFHDPSRPPLFSFFDAPDQELLRYYPGAVREGSTIRAEVRDTTEPEDPHRYIIRVSPLHDPEGVRTGVIQIVQTSPPGGGRLLRVPRNACSSPESPTIPPE